MVRFGPAAMIAAALLAGCATRPEPAPPAPAPVARPAPPPDPGPAPAAAARDWRDLALSPGDWSFEPGRARYAGFSLRCDSGRGRIEMARDGASGPLRVVTSYGERVVAPGASLPAADPLFDEIAFSRGRFAVEAEGSERLIVPTWPEPARVIEDCRG